MHVEHYGRPSLALDLMEEFRPLIVDSVVLTCVNKRIIGPEDFSVELGNVHRLTGARRKFLMQYESAKTLRFSTRSSRTKPRTSAVLSCKLASWPKRRAKLPSIPVHDQVSLCTSWCPDIEDDKRRGRIHRIWKSFGQWMQYSVFECDLTRAQYLVLRHRLDDYIKKAEGDSVRFYFLWRIVKKKLSVSAAKCPIREEQSLCKFFLAHASIAAIMSAPGDARKYEGIDSAAVKMSYTLI